MTTLKVKTQFALILALVLASSMWTEAQTAAKTRRPAQGTVVVERRPAAPQVITVLHRINGLTMLRLLRRSGQQVGAFDLDDVFNLKGVHTNIIAGLALDDGETVAAWLPEAEVEIETTLPFAAAAQAAQPALPSTFAPRATTAPMAAAEGMANGIFSRPDITIIERDGKSYQARYIGLDGITGLSLLKLSEKNLPSRSMSGMPAVAVGQQMRLYSPEPVGEEAATSNNSIYVRLGESEGQIVSIARGRSGEISRIRIKSAKLSPANIGAVVVNDGGQTIGIVESIDGSEANVLSPIAIRAAAKRVLARQASVPRPWLGITGEPVAFASLDRIVRKGWEIQRATSLLQTQRGILLNSVAPGSPADLAALRAGDVIVEVNNDDVKTSDDFSLFLAESAAKPVRFTVMRPNLQEPKSITVKLSQSIDPGEGGFMFPGLRSPAFLGDPLMEHGIETVPLRQLEGSVSRAVSGLLVIHVQPASAAFKAGLQTRDVIEAINGQPVSALSFDKLELSNAGYTLNVLRNKQKMVLTVIALEK